MMNFLRVKQFLSIILGMAILSVFPLKASDHYFAQHFISVKSGNNQHSREGQNFELPLTIYCVNSIGLPEVGVPVKFSYVKSESQNADTTIVSDSLGLVTYHLGTATKAGSFQYIATVPSNPEQAPLILTVHVRKSNWIFLLSIGLLGGLGLFLLGMSMMSEGMQNSAGDKMRNILSKLTHNRFVALGLGALVTMTIQSSSATNVMLVSFVNSKLMRFRQTIGVMLGAAIGTTITAQIIAFKLTDYALLFIALGLAVQYFMPKQATKELGKAILGFGILFFGMHIMSESMYPLRSYEPFLKVIMNMQNPALGILVGALLTALIQSSSAFIGILIILSMQGLLTFNAAIPLLIGANVGTSITAILASLNGSREAKQVALSHTVFKIIGAVIILFFLASFSKLVLYIGGQSSHFQSGIASPRQIANAHTIYNIVLCSLLLPFTNSFAGFIQWIFPEKEEPEKAFQLKYINEGLLATPVLALDSSRLELVRMMKKVYFMTEKIIHPFLERSTETLPQIDTDEKEINYLRDEIAQYLLEITQNDIATELVEEAFTLMNAVREFEQIADIVSHQLKEKAASWCESEYQFSEEGKQELLKYHEHTLAIIVQALKVYESKDIQAAKKLKSRYKRYRKEFFEFERQHYERLKENLETTQSSSKTHLEIITLLRVISNHATNTSRNLIYRNKVN